MKWEINEQLRKNNIVEDSKIKESIKIKSLEEDKNATDSYLNWFEKNKFKKKLAIDSNIFNYRYKIGEFRYDEIKDFANKIRNNAIIEISAKKDLNALNEIKTKE